MKVLPFWAWGEAVGQRSARVRPSGPPAGGVPPALSFVSMLSVSSGGRTFLPGPPVGAGPRVLAVAPLFPCLPCLPSGCGTGWGCLLGDPVVGVHRRGAGGLLWFAPWVPSFIPGRLA
eukprot:9492189-Pyramimonas_sp.AAC.1